VFAPIGRLIATLTQRSFAELRRWVERSPSIARIAARRRYILFGSPKIQEALFEIGNAFAESPQAEGDGATALNSRVMSRSTKTAIAAGMDCRARISGRSYCRETGIARANQPAGPYQIGEL
jgi:hypothetical protein